MLHRSMLHSINPYTHEIIADHECMSDFEVDVLLAHTAQAWSSWRMTSQEHRAQLFRVLAVLLTNARREAALMMCDEMGKPYMQGLAEIDKCAMTCAFHADNAGLLFRDETRSPLHPHARIIHEPLGVILAIMPWNFPFWQSIRACLPALLAGNAVVLKPAPEVSGCAAMLQRMFDEAGMNGAVTTLRVSVDQTQRCIAHHHIAGVTFTGSTRGGSKVAETAGRNLKKTVLELGGSDAMCVCADADVEAAAKAAIEGRMVNAGQSCIAVKRCIVMREVQEEFEEALRRNIAMMRPGNPRDIATTLGPLARPDLCTTLQTQVRTSLEQGARALVKGGMTGHGNLFAPMIISDVQRGMSVADEEVFGPVLALQTASTEDEMIALANDTSYGLGASVMSSDPQRAYAIARRLHVGMVSINDYVKSDPRLPFGGIRHSGFGRELGMHGVMEFVNVKTIVTNEP